MEYWVYFARKVLSSCDGKETGIMGVRLGCVVNSTPSSVTIKSVFIQPGTQVPNRTDLGIQHRTSGASKTGLRQSWSTQVVNLEIGSSFGIVSDWIGSAPQMLT